MARRRMIDPNFWESEDVARLSMFGRLLFIGMISNADDQGRGRAHPVYLKSIVFPYDDIETEKVEQALAEIGLNTSVVFYQQGHNRYYAFAHWNNWQRVDKPQPSKIPPAPEGTAPWETDGGQGRRISREELEEIVRSKETAPYEQKEKLLLYGEEKEEGSGEGVSLWQGKKEKDSGERLEERKGKSGEELRPMNKEEAEAFLKWTTREDERESVLLYGEEKEEGSGEGVSLWQGKKEKDSGERLEERKGKSGEELKPMNKEEAEAFLKWTTKEDERESVLLYGEEKEEGSGEGVSLWQGKKEKDSGERLEERKGKSAKETGGVLLWREKSEGEGKADVPLWQEKEEGAFLFPGEKELRNCSGASPEPFCDKARLREEKEREEKLKEDCMGGAAGRPAPEPAFKMPLNDGSLFSVFQEDCNRWAELYPAVDVCQEMRKMIGWLEANRNRRKTKNGIRRFINGWLAREQDKAREWKKQGSDFEERDYSNIVFYDPLAEMDEGGEL